MADNQSLLDWLSGPVLTQLVESQDIKAGLPAPMPPALYTPSGTDVVGVNVQWEAIQGVRQNATLTDPNSPSRRVDTNQRTRKQAVALGTRENIGFDSEFIAMLQSGVPILQQRAKMLQIQKVRDFKQRAENLRVSLPHSAFALGAINVDGNGNLLPSSTGAVMTVNFSIPGTSLNGAGKLTTNSTLPSTTQTVGDWSLAATDIEAALRAIGDSYTYYSNYPVGTIMYGRNVPGYFANNTSMQTFMSRNQGFGGKFLDSNEVPQGLMDYSWQPVHRAYFNDKNNAVQTWFNPKSIYIIPPVSEDWYENVECSLPIPSGIPFANSFDNLENFSGMFPLKKGYGSYCYGSLDPISLTCVQQYYSLPLIKNPYVVWEIQCAP
jgi:hypothetical protein